MKKQLIKRFYPTEQVLIAYLLITGVIILFNPENLHKPVSHLIFRTIVILALLAFSLPGENIQARNLFRFIRMFFPLTLLAYLYKETDYLNNLIFRQDLDPFFSKLEAELFGTQPSEWFSLKFNSDFFAELMYFGYFSYYLLLVGIPLYFYLKIGADFAGKLLFLVITSFLIYYSFFIVFPVAGPQFYFSQWPAIPQGYLFGHIMKIIQANGEAPTAAFPSSHVSICLMILMFSYQHSRQLLKVILPVAVLLIASTVYLRAHYVIDVLAAFVFTPVIYHISVTLHKVLNPFINTPSTS